MCNSESNTSFITDGVWESLGDYTERLKIPQGWIVRSWIKGSCIHQIIVEDYFHTWKIEKEPNRNE